MISDIIVIGGGYSGLATARSLRRSGASVVLLEARARFGGRTLTRIAAEAPLDMGAQWIGPGQPEVKRLAAEFGFAVQARPAGGVDVHYRPHPEHEGPIDLSDAPAFDEAAALAAIARLDGLAQAVDPEDPAQGEQSRRFDAETVASWCTRELPPAGAEIAFAIVDGFIGLPEQVSFLHALFYARANGGFASLAGLGAVLHDGEVVPEGLGTLALRIGDDLGDIAHLDQRVVAIGQDVRDVRVRTGRGDTFTARAAILALPPAVADAIEFDPALPIARRSIQKRFTPCCRLKFHVVYERPFWRDEGKSGEARGGGFITFDGSVNERRGILTGFFGSREQPHLHGLPQAERARLAVERLTLLFGARAREPLAYEDMFWLDEPLTLGCVAAPGPGVWSQFGQALRARCDRVIFAGAETALVMPGQVEGAIASGLKAAQEALALL